MNHVNRSTSLWSRDKRNGQVILSSWASDLQWAYAPEMFTMYGDDNKLYTFHKTSTNYCGTIDNEVVGWVYECREFPGKIRVEIAND